MLLLAKTSPVLILCDCLCPFSSTTPPSPPLLAVPFFGLPPSASLFYYFLSLVSIALTNAIAATVQLLLSWVGMHVSRFMAIFFFFFYCLFKTEGTDYHHLFPSFSLHYVHPYLLLYANDMIFYSFRNEIFCVCFTCFFKYLLHSFVCCSWAFLCLLSIVFKQVYIIIYGVCVHVGISFHVCSC